MRVAKPSPEFWKLPLVVDHIARARRQVEMLAGADFMSHVESYRDYKPCDSPLEAIFALWWHVVIGPPTPDPSGPFAWALDWQKVVEVAGAAYRLDFEVTPTDSQFWQAAEIRGYRRQSIAVELDGHDFHERTKEQVAHRNTRDRALQSAGWIVLHFSGSELVRDPISQVNQVLQVCRGQWTAAAPFVWRDQPMELPLSEVARRIAEGEVE
jgi:hypothetical protein